jgi:gamma-glutamyl-gamma-aminobutyrate hydrolase PuuD
MKKRPIILVSPDQENQGREHKDPSISLSSRYLESIMSVGGLPLTMPVTTSREVIAECVAASGGVLLTGGDDIQPELYTHRLPA